MRVTCSVGSKGRDVALPQAVNLLKEERRREGEGERKGSREKLGLESLDGGGGERARKLECVGSGLRLTKFIVCNSSGVAVDHLCVNFTI